MFHQKKHDQVQIVTHWSILILLPINRKVYLIVHTQSDVDFTWNEIYTMAHGVVMRLMYHKSCIFATKRKCKLFIHFCPCFSTTSRISNHGISNQGYGMIRVDAKTTDKRPLLHVSEHIQTSHRSCTDS